MTSNAVELVDRLARATSAHDLDGIVACFAEDYVNETPAHPLRGFHGRAQVRRNWTQILAAVPNLTAQVLATAVDGDTVWSEWTLTGTRGDGESHEMRGVIIFAVADELIRAARFYLEPVEHDSGTVDDAISRSHLDPLRPGIDVILVAGGTGLLGRRIVQQLSVRGETVRVLTRDPRRAEPLSAGVQIVTGDVRHGGLDTVVAGCSTVISAVHGFTGPSRTSPAARGPRRQPGPDQRITIRRGGALRPRVGGRCGTGPSDVIASHEACSRTAAAHLRAGWRRRASDQLSRDVADRHRRQAPQRWPGARARAGTKPNQLRVRRGRCRVRLSGRVRRQPPR